MPVLAPPHYLEDWRDQLRRELKRAGFVDATIIEELDPLPIELVYYHAMLRLIEPRPRRVHEARGFEVAGALGKKYYALRHKITQGEPLRPHQSSRILSAAANDEYLANWGIQHLHLGSYVLESGLVERTGPILLGIFTPDDAYVIGIESGEQGHGSPWRDERHLDTVVENWPHLFREFEVERAHADAPRPDADALQPRADAPRPRADALRPDADALRPDADAPRPDADVLQPRAGAPRPRADALRPGAALSDENQGHPDAARSPVVLSNGRAYLPWGGGVTADGRSARAVELATHWKARVEAAEAATVTHFDEFVAVASRVGIELGDRVVLRLLLGDPLRARLEDAHYGWRLEPASPVTILQATRGKWTSDDRAPRQARRKR